MAMSKVGLCSLIPILFATAPSEMAQSNSTVAAFRHSLRDLQRSWRPEMETCSGPPFSFWQEGKQALSRVCEQLSISVSSHPATGPFLPNNPKALACSVCIANIGGQVIETDYANWRLLSLVDSDQSALDPARVPKGLRLDSYWLAVRRTTLGSLDSVFGNIYSLKAQGETATILYRLPSGREVQFTVSTKN
jgi:hypothetical protein